MKEKLTYLSELLSGQKRYYGAAALLLITSNLFRLLEPQVLRTAVDGLMTIYNQSADTASNTWAAAWLPAPTAANISVFLWSICGIYIAIALFRGAAMFTSSVLSASTTERAIQRLRSRLFSHIQALPLDFHATVSTAEMIQRCTGDVETVKKFIGTHIVESIMLGSLFLGSFYMMCQIYLPYALIAIAASPLILILSILFFRFEGKIWEEHEAEQDKLTAIVEENLSGIRVVKAFAQEKYETNRFDVQNNAKFNIGKRHVRLHAIYWPLSDWLYLSQITIAVFFGGYYALSGKITLGELVAFYSYVGMVSWPMRRIGQIVSEMGMAFVAIDRIGIILRAAPENYTDPPQKDSEELPLKGKIVFDKVGFKYPNTEEWALYDVSFSIDAGKTLAIAGETGSGKTTIIQLLARFYEPQQGTIWLDDKPLSTYNKVYLRSRLGIVLQKTFLFSNTIRNNIAYAQPHAPDEAIHAAAHSAAIDEILHIFPMGYETTVGEKGVTLSGGQKQRVTIARTLLETTDILILDDATSAVDTETEWHIRQAVAQYAANKTCLVISHRITTLQAADYIVVLNKGQVAEQGTPAELLKQDGFYKKVHDVQVAIEMDYR